MSDSRIRVSALAIMATRADQPVVIAEPDFVGGDGVILVDDGDSTELQEPVERIQRVDVAAPVLGIVEGKQELCGSRVVPAQCLLVGVHQPCLACGSRPPGCHRDAGIRAPGRDGGGRSRWRRR